MPLSYSLLLPPLKQRVQRPWLWPTIADGTAISNQTPWVQYPFRPFWQPQKVWLWPPAADIAATGAPPLFPIPFRKGGFWQPQKRWGTQRPADVAVPNAPLLRQIPFRRGGLWQFFRAFFAGPGSNPPIFTPYVPPPTGVPTGEVSGSGVYSSTGVPVGEVSGTTSPGATGVPTGN